jgi:outer membrane receptor protein involved in Fe transport
MSILKRRHRVPLAVAILILGAGSSARPQSVTPAATPSGPSGSEDADEQIIELSPFIVEATEDDGYRATSTLAGTRIRTELKDVGSAISVVTEAMLRDTGATKSEDLLVYTTNTEVGGMRGNFAGLGNGQLLDDTTARIAPHNNTRVRGLSAADNTRDFFLTDIPWDSFNVGRVDLQRGPNSILFGLGSPAGIINSSTNGAALANSGKIEFRYGSYSSARSVIDVNRVLIPSELAVRFAALDDRANYRQKPAFNDDRRVYGALRYDPQFLTGSGAHTTVKLNIESGRIDANRPRVIPPGDQITPWFATLNRLALNPQTVGESNPARVAALTAAGDRAAGVRKPSLDGGAANANYNPYIGSFGRNYGGIVAVFSDPASGDFALRTTDLQEPRGLKADGSIDADIGGIPWTIMSGIIPFKDYAGAAHLPGEQYGLYKNNALQDRSIFDFYNQLLDGPNKAEWSDHTAWNASLSQTFFNNRVGVELVYDRQSYERGQRSMMSDYGQAITIDINTHRPDGSVNPNFGRAAILSDAFANNLYATEREAKRVTAFAELRATDYMEESLLSRLLGRHVLTGLYSNDTADTERRSWFRYAADALYGDQINDRLLRNRGINTLSYIGPSLADRTSASGANLPRLSAIQLPRSGTLRYFDSHYVGTVSPGAAWVDQYGSNSVQADNPANYAGWTDYRLAIISDDAGDRDRLTTSSSLARDDVTSRAFVWQAFLFDNLVVPTVGFRKDKAKNFSLPAGPKRPNGDETIFLESPDYRLPSIPGSVVSGDSTSWSVVVHSPRFITDRLPAKSSVSLFYNESENFQPAAGRVDALGNAVGAPTGKTKDYGFMISALEDRVTLKVNWYRTDVMNAALPDFSGSYMLPAAEAWGYMFARRNLERWGGFANGYAATAGQTTAQAIADGDLVCRAFMNGLPPDSFYTTWGIDRSQWSGWMNWTTPPGMTITGDTMSKGVEYEISAQPASNWSLAINASKTTAQRTNMAESYAVWAEARWAFYNTVVPGTDGRGRVGDVRFWDNGYNPGETLRGKFGREFMAPYTLYRLQEGSNVPELRPWRFNLVTNYSFGRGALKGLNLGGGLRWQDKSVVGYRMRDIQGDASSAAAYDLENPFMGPSETNIDLWAGYQRKIADKYSWRVQLNVSNVFASDELIPVTVQPDGSMAVGRIPDATTWNLTNTFSF